jgi:hypothetical protein
MDRFDSVGGTRHRAAVASMHADRWAPVTPLPAAARCSKEERRRSIAKDTLPIAINLKRDAPDLYRDGGAKCKMMVKVQNSLLALSKKYNTHLASKTNGQIGLVLPHIVLEYQVP